MSRNIFITGTGTDVGKTYVTGLIVKKLKESGADAGLGTINGVALTAYYLKEQGIALKGIILNHYRQGNVLCEDNRKMCEFYTGVPVIACVVDGDTELSIGAEELKSLYDDGKSCSAKQAEQETKMR